MHQIPSLFVGQYSVPFLPDSNYALIEFFFRPCLSVSHTLINNKVLPYSRKTTFEVFNMSNYKIGRNNKVSNRLICLNSKITLDWRNMEENCYEIHCKQKFITNINTL